MASRQARAPALFDLETVAFIGSSIIKYLHALLIFNGRGPTVISKSGGVIRDFYAIVDNLPRHVRCIFLQIGSNDICRLPPFQCAILFNNLLLHIRQKRPDVTVVISSVPPRLEDNFRPRGPCYVRWINQKIFELNCFLREFSFLYENVVFLSHSSFYQTPQRFLSFDGLHLSRVGIATLADHYKDFLVNHLLDRCHVTIRSPESHRAVHGTLEPSLGRVNPGLVPRPEVAPSDSFLFSSPATFPPASQETGGARSGRNRSPLAGPFRRVPQSKRRRSYEQC